VYFIDGKRHVLATGNYKKDICPALEREGRKSGGYTRVVVAYIAELKEIRAIHLGATAEAGFVKAIAAARGIPEHKASLYGLSDLESEIWVFQFSGEFEPVVFAPKDAKNMAATVPAKKGNKKIYFQPILQAGVIKSTNPKYKEAFTSVCSMRVEYSEYIHSEQAYLRGKYENPEQASQPVKGYDPNNAQHTANPFDTADDRFPSAHQKQNAIVGDDPFPQVDVTSYSEGVPNLDDIPF